VIVLSDTSPLNYLILIGQVEVLPAIFEQLFIPRAVASELAHSRAPDAVRQWISSPPEWCQVRTVTEVDRTIPLGQGEREAISLAVELHADLLLVDDRVARSHAERRGLRVAGTLNVLEAAAERKLLKLPEAIRGLRQTNFHIAEEVLAHILAADAERNSSNANPRPPTD
jgi:predicted nucleic acid-binding protein